MVAEFERSGLIQREFAARRRVGVSQLRYWIYKLRAEQTPEAPLLRLLPVRVVPLPAPEARAAEVEVVLPGGVIVRVTIGADVGYAAALARALIASC